MSAVRKSARSGTRGYAHLIEIGAPVARVWRALTDPGLIRIWSGQVAQVDPRKGGVYRIAKQGGGSRESHIDIFDVNRRLRLIYLSERGTPPSDSAVVDDFLLDARGSEGKTTLRLLGSGVPDSPEWDSHYKRYRISWERLMARIRVTLEKPPAPKPPPKKVDPPLRGLDY